LLRIDSQIAGAILTALRFNSHTQDYVILMFELFFAKSCCQYCE